MSLVFDNAEALARGEIPDSFMEENRLLPSSSAQGKAFERTMKSIYNRLLQGSGKDPAAHPVHFMLSVDSSPNAFIESSANPPIIVMTTGLINEARHESDLAAVLAHELGHQYFADKLGPLKENGKIEEFGADIRAPLMLRQAHYPQDALSKIFKKISENDSYTHFMMGSLSDPHPAMKNRLSALEVAESGLIRGKYGMGTQQNIQDRAVDSSLKQAAGSARFESFIDKLLVSKNYHSANQSDKIKILQEIIQKEQPGWDPYYKSRRKDVKAQIAVLKPKQAPDAFNDLVDTVVAFSGNYRDYYDGLTTAVSGKEPNFIDQDKPLGRLVGLQNEINHFIKSSNPDEIAKSAERLNSFITRYDKPGSGFSNIQFTGFTWPENLDEISSPQSPPWETHVQTALNGSDAVKETLARLSIHQIDPRLKGLSASGTNINSFMALSGTQLEKELYYFGLGENARSGTHTISILPDGKIAGVISASEKENQKAAFKQRMASEREATENAMLSSVDWTELEQNFEGFVKKYEKQLIKATTADYEENIIVANQIEQKFPFAETFIQKASELVKQDSAVFQPKLRDFILRQMSASDITDTTIKHPYVDYTINNDNSGFSLQDKLCVLSYTNYYDRENKENQTPESRWLLSHEKLFDGLPKQTIDELRELVKEFSELCQSSEGRSNLDRYQRKVVSDILLLESYKTLRDYKGVVSLDDLAFVRGLANLPDKNVLAIAEALRQEVIRLTVEYAQNTELGSNPENLVNGFLTLASEPNGAASLTSIFLEQPALRNNYQITLKNAIDSQDDAARKSLLEKLLSHTQIAIPEAADQAKISGVSVKPYIYNGSIVDPDFKEWVFENYTVLLANELGQDDGTPAYFDSFKQQINQLTANVGVANASIILQRLSKKACGNHILLQTECAEYVKNTIESSNLEQIVKYNFEAAVGEQAFNIMSKSVTTRDASINFFTEAFSKEAASRYIAKMHEHANDEIAQLPRNKFLSKDLSGEAQIEQMELMHRNFWSLPFEVRVLAVQQILFESHERTRSEASIQKTIDRTLDKTLPRNAGKDMAAARTVVESYLEATESQTDRRLITASMLVANPPNDNNSGEKLSVGKGLNLVLSAIDPAGDKAKQAIESHPGTPPHIKEEFKDSKTAAKDPMRHEILEWVTTSNRDLPAAQQIIRTGKVLGAGSYGITVEGELTNGTVIARTLLYPHVREKAENEFGILQKASDILVTKDKRFAPVVDMMRQAARMSYIETDMDMAAKQAEVAAKLYNGLKVTVDGQDITFSAAKYLGHGKDHKDFEIISGEHFNDIVAAASTDSEKQQVCTLAKAQMAVELSHILSGRPFDHDRHGGQQRIINGNHIGEFDFGAMTITETSDRQKQMIGHVLGGVIKQHFVKGRPLEDAMRKEMTRVPQNQEEKDFLASVERGILALGNFNSQLGENVGLGEMLGTAYVNAQIDPVVEAAMRDRLPGISDRVFKELEEKGRTTGITITVPTHAFEKSEDQSPLCAPPKEGMLERIPLKDEHVQAGVGITAATVGAGALAYAAHKSGQEQQNQYSNDRDTGEQPAKQQKRSIVRRAIGACGAALTTLGAALAVDGLAFHAKGANAALKYAKSLTSKASGSQASGSNSLIFNKTNSLIAGAVAIGIGAVMLLRNQQKKRQEQQAEENGQTSWVNRSRGTGGLTHGVGI